MFLMRGARDGGRIKLIIYIKKIFTLPTFRENVTAIDGFFHNENSSPKKKKVNIKFIKID